MTHVQHFACHVHTSTERTLAPPFVVPAAAPPPLPLCHNPQAQPLSGDGSVRVRVSSSDGTSPRHSVLVRVSNAGSSPSPYVSLGGAPTSSSDDLPSNGGRWAHKQPVSLASHPIKLHATYADFEAELQAKLEARRADMQRGSSSCGGGSVGEAGAARPADAFLEPDQGVQSVKEVRAGRGVWVTGDTRLGVRRQPFHATLRCCTLVAAAAAVLLPHDLSSPALTLTQTRTAAPCCLSPHHSNAGRWQQQQQQQQPDRQATPQPRRQRHQCNSRQGVRQGRLQQQQQQQGQGQGQTARPQPGSSSCTQEDAQPSHTQGGWCCWWCRCCFCPCGGCQGCWAAPQGGQAWQAVGGRVVTPALACMFLMLVAVPVCSWGF